MISMVRKYGRGLHSFRALFRARRRYGKIGTVTAIAMMVSDFKAQRIKMVDGQLRTTEVFDRAIVDAMLDVPREKFVPQRRRALAYIDEDIEIAAADGGRPARYLMEPSPFARLLQLAAIAPGEFVLDIGCGTGYSAAVISRLCGSAVALEEDARLAAEAAATLDRLGCDNVAVVEGPLTEGYAPQAPFDVIIVEGAVDEVPQPLFDQLRDGGRLAAVVGHGNAGRAMLYRKEGKVVASRASFNAAVRPLPGFQRSPVFEF